MILNAQQTAQILPYAALAAEIALLLQDPSVQVPARLVQALPGGGSMLELVATLCQHCAHSGTVVVDTTDAVHEAGDLLHAGLDASAFKTLGDIVRTSTRNAQGPVLFKSCGWAGWDLATTRLACSNANE
jgi:ornithine cyclodeaminase/alanine dehydrogenase-like protein (mu-crystallin family)